VMTAKDVTECIGRGAANLGEEDLGRKCGWDPRLNGVHALVLAFLISERLRIAQRLQLLFGNTDHWCDGVSWAGGQ